MKETGFLLHINSYFNKKYIQTYSQMTIQKEREKEMSILNRALKNIH